MRQELYYFLKVGAEAGLSLEKTRSRMSQKGLSS